jgi:hypothetical protein
MRLRMGPPWPVDPRAPKVRPSDGDLLDELEWHGCLTGDCPHNFQGQCDKSLADAVREVIPRRKK